MFKKFEYHVNASFVVNILIPFTRVELSIDQKKKEKKMEKEISSIKLNSAVVKANHT